VTDVWLAIIAIAVVAMAAAQIAAAVVMARLARQTSDSLQALRRDLQPVIEKVDRLADAAGEVTALAAVQMQRVDRLLAETTARFDEAFAVVQEALLAPLQRGSTLLAAIRAGWAIFRDWQDRRRPRREDEDALFVG
jgi:hypothetical protein